ncbi:ABC transporter ATP-binding protein [Arenibaculum pallidiluteum]|uniref:ABC transporter ATP-binding protein n=1 Tax=Arenibaculum pallidiluteum TaxID=2812559 RepID=UPI001A974E61|nr:sn-glycerol-3-phosphate ABC transporter ATP-binding protein UgpC [Arenibaculum pallidiluteum]
MTAVRLSGIEKRYGELTVLRDVHIDIADREFVVFVGPSGCGKSTLLRSIAGLETVQSGRIVIGGTDVTHVEPARRGVAMVFQSYALYPHMTVRENIAFGLRMAKLPEAEIRDRINRAAEILKIGELMDRKPKALSGGQRQRVAIGRAIVRDPKVFLFDEPLSNLDAALRVQMRLELIKLHRTLRATMIYVTHDQVEAMTMADRIVVLNQGRVEQVGSPLELYRTPRNRFVAGFIGSPEMNFLEVPVLAASAAGVSVRLPDGQALLVPADGSDLSGQANLTLGIRPEHMREAGTGPADVWIRGEAGVVEHLGGETLVHLRLPDGSQLNAKASGETGIEPGTTPEFGLRAELCHLFDAAGLALPRLAGPSAANPVTNPVASATAARGA